MIVTVQQHILEQQQQHHPTADGTFSWLLSGITLATKMIQAKVRRAGLSDILGAAGEINVQGEVQQNLDIYANEAVQHCLGFRPNVAELISEENEKPITFERTGDEGRYIVVFDPLDGSSNIDVGVSVGTTFSVLRQTEAGALQPGHQQVAAGYVVYGSSTILVYTTGRGVFGFTLEPSIGAFLLSNDNMKMPTKGDIYSVNEAYADSFPEHYRTYINELRTSGYKSRYIGSMVADYHRTLLKGGVFLYPPTASNAEGKLRLLYEANPIAFITEQAGGKAIDGTQRTLDIQPKSIHERTPLVVGGMSEVEHFERVRDASKA